MIACLDRNKNNKDKCMFLLYLHANAVNNNKGAGTSSGEQQTSGLAMEFSIKVHVIEVVHALIVSACMYLIQQMNFKSVQIKSPFF